MTLSCQYHYPVTDTPAQYDRHSNTATLVQVARAKDNHLSQPGCRLLPRFCPLQAF